MGWLNGRYDTPMSSAALEKLDWDHIDTVFLDLDGTLLDLGFDNDFWLDFIPLCLCGIAGDDPGAGQG